MNLVNFIFEAASKLKRWPHPAVLYGSSRYSYQHLLSRVRQSASVIRQCGVLRGDRVAIVCCDCPDFICGFLGSIAARSIAVPISTMLPAGELEFILADCGAKAVLLSPDQLEKVSPVLGNLPDLKTVFMTCRLRANQIPDPNIPPPEITRHSNAPFVPSWLRGVSQTVIDFDQAISESPPAAIDDAPDDELAFILYTSGSTGKPKGAMHLHRNLPWTVNTYCRHILNVQPEDRLFSSSRLFFAYGLGNSLSFPLSSGAGAILCSERPTPPVISDVFRRHRPTIFFGVPAVFRALIEYREAGNPLDTESIVFCVSAGEKLPKRVYHDWKAITGLEILDGIGSTEMLHMFMSNSRDSVTPGSSGKPLPCYEAKLLDPAGNEIPGTGTGDLLIKGGSASPGYWRNPEKTASTMLGEWMRTGDIYRRDSEGNYWFDGRSDDLFKVKGLWISPVEVEEALLNAPEVSEAAVVAAYDPDGLSRVVAFVVLRNDHLKDAAAVERIKSAACQRLQPYKCPSEIYFLDKLPRTATGKLQRFKLREARQNADFGMQNAE
ncbi:MAG TPA: benzoate-CoA ligase family protein [Acidobacteriota bacterium]|jgi:benzoate-CoA ligase